LKIQLEQVNPQYPSSQKPILQLPVTLSVEAGDHVKICGGNGSGKSTLLRTLVGLHRAYWGNYFVDKINARRLSSAQIRQKGLAYLPQHSLIFPSLTVQDFRKLIKSKTFSQPAGNMLTELLSQIDARMPFGTLAGGVQQLLGLLSIMARPATIYLLDEPFRHLDSTVSEKMKTFFTDLIREQTIALLIVDHLIV